MMNVIVVLVDVVVDSRSAKASFAARFVFDEAIESVSSYKKPFF